MQNSFQIIKGAILIEVLQTGFTIPCCWGFMIAGSDACICTYESKKLLQTDLRILAYFSCIPLPAKTGQICITCLWREQIRILMVQLVLFNCWYSCWLITFKIGGSGFLTNHNMDWSRTDVILYVFNIFQLGNKFDYAFPTTKGASANTSSCHYSHWMNFCSKHFSVWSWCQVSDNVINIWTSPFH